MFGFYHKKYLIWLFLLVSLGFLLRIINLTQIPPALHGDELGTGYNAYSLIKTGADEYGKFFPFTFRNDFSPLIFYATLPSIWLFGLSEFSTRLPTAVVGTLMLPVFYILVLQLFKNPKLALLATFFLTISSWEIRSSRMALEMIWALFFQMVGVVFFLKSKLNKKYLLYSFVSFGLAVVTYQSAKITTPLLITSVYWFDKSFFKKNIKKIIILLFTCVMLPIAAYFLVRPFREMRFVGISVFTLWKSTLPTPTNFLSLANIFSLGQMIFTNYLHHFSPDILFFDSSRLRYFQVEGLGMFFSWQIIGIMLGLTIILRSLKDRAMLFLVIWILISPLPAALTTGVPFANIGRSLLMFPALEIVYSIGVFRFFEVVRQHLGKKYMVTFAMIFALVVSLQFNLFLNRYFIDMPIKYALFWGQPLKKAMPFISQMEQSVKQIIITDTVKQGYMYLLFYGAKEPSWLQTQVKTRNPVVGYSQIGNYEFRPIKWESDRFVKNILLVGTAKEIPNNNLVVFEVKQQDGQVLLRIVKT